MLLLLALLAPAAALILDVEAGRSRCLQEILSKHDLVKGSYALLGEPVEGERSGFTVKARPPWPSPRPAPRPPLLTRARRAPQVTGPSDVIEFSQADTAGSKFSFTASSGGSHSVCFANGGATKRAVELVWAAGAAAIDYADVAKVEQLKPLELEMRKLEDRLAAVRREMQFQREREESHRDLVSVSSFFVVAQRGRARFFCVFDCATPLTRPSRPRRAVRGHKLARDVVLRAYCVHCDCVLGGASALPAQLFQGEQVPVRAGRSGCRLFLDCA